MLSRIFGIFIFHVVFAGLALSQSEFRLTFDQLLARYPAPAQTNPEDQKTILYREVFASVNEKGLTTFREYEVFRLNVAADQADLASDAAVEWNPWCEGRPKLRARILASSGRVSLLDPKTITEEPTSTFDQTIFIDRRQLRAALPGLEKGVIVEIEKETAESTPFFLAGAVRQIVINPYENVVRTVIRIQMPAALPAPVWVGKLPFQPTQSTSKGFIEYRYEVSALEKNPNDLDMRPLDDPATPFLSFGTGKDWKSIAAAYAKVVEDRIANQNIDTLWAGLAAPNLSRTQRISALLERLHAQVRYTGIELAESQIIPRLPGEVLSSRYGDCKDKSTLLVAALRKLGISAHVALLSTRNVDPARQVFGIGQFNHAIVRVAAEGNEPEIWIDATDTYAPVGILPFLCQGRLALVASPLVTDLTRTPVTANNSETVTRYIRFRVGRGADVEEVHEARGGLEPALRSLYSSGVTQDEIKNRQNSFKTSLLLNEFVKLDHPPAEKLDVPFTIRSEGKQSKVAPAGLLDAAIMISIEPSFEYVPWGWRQELAAEKSDKTEPAPKPRSLGYRLPYPYRIEYRYVLEPPTGYELRDKPDSLELPMGAGLYSQTLRKLPQGSVELIISFRTDTPDWTSHQVQEFREKYRKLIQEQAILRVAFIHLGMEKLSVGDFTDALPLILKEAPITAAEPVAMLRQAMARLAVLDGDRAAALARKALAVAPNDAYVHYMAAEVLAHDSLGRRFGQGAPLAECVAANRRAAELDPDNVNYKAMVAVALEHFPSGFRYADKKYLEEAIAVYASLGNKLDGTSFTQNHATALLYAGRFREMRAILQKLGQQPDPLLSLIATAKLDGLPAALSALSRAVSQTEQRIEILRSGTLTATAMGDVPLARDFVAAAFRMAPANPQVRGLAKIFEKAEKQAKQNPLDAPESLPARFFRLALDPAIPETERWPRILTTFSRNVAQRLNQDSVKQAFLEKLGEYQLPGLPPKSVLALLESMLLCTPSGPVDGPWRVSCDSPAPQTSDLAFYVVRESGEFKLQGFSTTPETQALAAWEALQAKDFEAAKRWLDWAMMDTPIATRGTGMLAGPAFRYVWSAVKPSEEDYRLGIASLLGYNTNEFNDLVIPVLESARAKAKLVAVQRELDLALCEAYSQRGMYKELLTAATRLRAAAPNAGGVDAFSVKAWLGLHRLAEAEKHLAAQVKAADPNPEALMLWASALAEKGDLPAAAEAARKARLVPSSATSETNNAVWFAFAASTLVDEDIEALRKVSSYNNYALHTLAAAQAERGQLVEARNLLLETLSKERVFRRQPKDLLVLGILWEKCGLREEALAAYSEAAKSSSGPT
ncbi:DUF3857 and transglutaminase domain-containing protein, partial [Nostoc sp. NIES-2111]